MATLLFNITHGFQARMLLRSAIAETLLADGAQLIVVSQNAHEEYFRREFDHPQIVLEPMPDRFSKVEANLVNLRQYLLMNPSLGTTLNFKNEAFRRQSPLKHRVARIGNAVLGRVPPLRKAYLAAERALFAGREYDDLLARRRPDLVVTGTPGYHRNDVHLLRAARRARVPTATVMLSWDNLTSKGYMGAVPDHLLVWSDLMADEAVEYHDYPRKNITWTGAAQFDQYLEVRESFDAAAWRRNHGIASDACLIVYGTINPAVLPHEPAIVQQIVAAMRDGRFRSRPHLWLRLHPQVVGGQYAQSLEPYRALAGPDVTVEAPPVQSEQLAWDLPQADATHLAMLLAAADVVATPCSTFVIDAVCANTPVVNVLFDGPDPVDPALSVHRFRKYTHYAKILTTGGLAIADTIDSFVRLVDRYFADPTTDAAGRASVIRQQLNQLDGQAGVRTARELMRLATSRSPGVAMTPHAPVLTTSS